MKFFLSLFFCGAVSLSFLSTGSRLHAADSITIEDYHKLQGDLAQLQEAYTDMVKRVTQLATEVERLRSAIREERENSVSKAAQFATVEQIKALRDALEEVDRKRQADNSKVIDAVERELRGIEAKLAAQPVAPPPRNRDRDRDRDRDSNKEKETSSSNGKAKEKELPVAAGEFYPHKVGRGESLSAIIAAYNAEFKKQGKKGVTLDMVRKANPKINVNYIYVGQEILIPVPEK
ncbi:MAG: LysM peptidoglycan-binding domain-containing protein [Verrucomicrobiales bacterium]